MKFAYHQLDWLIPYYVDDYIELNDSQASFLETEVEKLLQWHCGNHLTSYAMLLRRANQDFQQGAMDADRLQLTSTRIEAYWKEIKRQASPAIARLFLTSEQVQLDDFFSAMQKKNREWLEDFQAQTEMEIREDYQERMSDELERWFGPLTAEQQQRVVQWSRDFKPLGMQGLLARQQWQMRLQVLLDHRKDDEAFYAKLEELFVNPYHGQPEQYLRRLEQNRSMTIGMLAELGERLTQEQLRHLDEMVRSVAADFDQLACAGEVLGVAVDGRRTSPKLQEVDFLETMTE
ncbi:MAG: DUF6279 family lipoprotein [Gammaproteobacteria bacterium]|nr:DUF6279 family lipoprotein [Gammaproteobacteria bacterium]